MNPNDYFNTDENLQRQQNLARLKSMEEREKEKRDAPMIAYRKQLEAERAARRLDALYYATYTSYQERKRESQKRCEETKKKALRRAEQNEERERKISERLRKEREDKGMFYVPMYGWMSPHRKDEDLVVCRRDDELLIKEIDIRTTCPDCGSCNCTCQFPLRRGKLRNSNIRAENEAPQIRIANSITAQTLKQKICKHFKRGDCRFGDRCRNSHETQNQSAANNPPPPAAKAQKLKPQIWKKAELFQEQQPINTQPPAVAISNATDDLANTMPKLSIQSKKPTVCRFFSKGHCHYGESCRYTHERNNADSDQKPTSNSKTI